MLPECLFSFMLKKVSVSCTKEMILELKSMVYLFNIIVYFSEVFTVSLLSTQYVLVRASKYLQCLFCLLNTSLYVSLSTYSVSSVYSTRPCMCLEVLTVSLLSTQLVLVCVSKYSRCLFCLLNTSLYVSLSTHVVSSVYSIRPCTCL